MPQMKGIISGVVIIIVVWQSISSTATIVSSMIATMV
jgi:hypothetical protein